MNAIFQFMTVAAIWGSTWLAITYQLGSISPVASVTYRFALAAAILMALCRLRGYSLRFPLRAHCGIALQGALLFSLNYIAIYLAEQTVPSGLVAVLCSTQAFLNLLGARFLFHLPLQMRTVAATLLGVIGVALMFLPEFALIGQSANILEGFLFGMAGTILASGGNMAAMHNQRAGVPVWAGAAWGMTYGALISGLAGCVIGVDWVVDISPAYLLSLAYLSLFGTIIAFLTYLTLLKNEGAGVASYVAAATPMVALLLSTAFEGYQWTWIAATGAVLILCGNVLVMKKSSRR